MKHALLVLALAGALFSGCGGDDSSDDGGSSSEASSQFERQFVAGCERSGTSSETCQCVYDELTAQGLSQAEITDGAAAVQADRRFPELAEAEAACRG